MKLSIVIPAYNEEDNIRITIEEICAAIKHISKIEDYQIVVVDDHSSDKTFDIASGIKDSHISCIRLSRRRGSHIAIRAGLKEATGDAVLFIAADGQDDQDILEEMLRRRDRGAKVVWGLRRSRAGEPWHVKIPHSLFYKVLSCLGGTKGAPIDVSRGNFFLLDRVVVDALNKCPERNTSLFGLILWAGFDQDSVEYERKMRRRGKSKWNFAGLLNLSRDWLIAFSNMPLVIFFWIGLSVVLVSIACAVFVTIGAIMGNAVRGWSVTLIAVMFLSGIQMIMLGLMGEYLWRSLDESRCRPLYFIEKRSG